MFQSIKFDQEPTVVQSMCPDCQQNGKTTMLLTKIPSFKQIIIVSFQCQHCGLKNNQIQFGGQLANKGIHIKFKVKSKQDLNREVVRSGFATIYITDLLLQIPQNGKGEINTIQGMLSNVKADLQLKQPLRKIQDQQNYQKINIFISKIQKLLQNPNQFQFTINDPSGNSYIKNPYAPKQDPQLKITLYNRSKQETQKMGYSWDNQQQQNKVIGSHKVDYTKPFNQQNYLSTQGLGFNIPCHVCGLDGEVRMCQTSVPYFKDLIVMAFTCQYCGAHSSEIKTLGEIPSKGRKIVLKTNKQSFKVDIRRDLFKSDNCGVNIPQIQLQLGYGTLGGVYTTVQGLFQKIIDHLSQVNQFFDSDVTFRSRIQKLFQDLNALRQGRLQFTLILDDPVGHSFLQNPSFPDKDINVTIQQYQRTFQQNQELGLNDMKV